MPWVEVCSSDDVPPNTMRGFDVGERRVLLVNLGGEIRALAGLCTHEVADLASGYLVGGRVTCPVHVSQFDVRTGEPLSPPATVALEVYAVKVEGGRILVEVP